MAAIRKSTNGTYEVRYYDAHGRRRGKTFKRREDAKRWMALNEAAKVRGEWIDPRDAATLFADVAEAWFAGTASLKPKTRVGYRQILDRHVLPAFGRRPIAKIAPTDVRAWLRGLDAAPGTVRNVYRVAKPIFDAAVADRLIAASPCVGVKLPRSPRSETVFLTADEVAVLAKAMPPRYRALVMVAAYTGLRAGELGALRVRNLDLLRGRITVQASLSDVGGKLHFGPTKTYRIRTVPLPRSLCETLAAHLGAQAHGPDDLVFAARNGAPMRHHLFYGRIFKPTVRRVLPERLHGLRFHDLRHTCAALLIAQGAHPKAISSWLGHSSIAVTMDRYGHLFPEHADELVAGLDTVLRAAGTA